MRNDLELERVESGDELRFFFLFFFVLVRSFLRSFVQCKMTNIEESQKNANRNISDNRRERKRLLKKKKIVKGSLLILKASNYRRFR